MDRTSIFVPMSSNTFIMMLTCISVAIVVLAIELVTFLLKSRSKGKSDRDPSLREYKRPPGPTPFPIIGNLASLDGYEVPYQAFGVLAKRYGPIISLRLGSVPTVVVNGIDNIKEVLITKSSHFDSRPNFRRYHDLFSGNKQNCKLYICVCYVFIVVFYLFACCRSLVVVFRTVILHFLCISNIWHWNSNHLALASHDSFLYIFFYLNFVLH